MKIDPRFAQAHANLAAECAVMRREPPPEAVHPALMPRQPRAANGDAERGVNERCMFKRRMNGVFDQHAQQGAQRLVVL